MADPNPNLFDGQGFYSDLQANAGVHYTHGVPPITVYRSQYNIGRELVRRASSALMMGLIDAHGQPTRFDNINFLFIGPSFTALRDQTRNDLTVFLESIAHLSFNEIKDKRNYYVLNNNGLHNKKLADIKWSQLLVNHQEEPDGAFHNNKYLHLLIFDEAHWGISSNGNIDSYFKQLADFLDRNFAERRRRPNLLIVKVSATIDVLIRSVDNYAPVDGHRVDWNALRQQPRFGAPTYRAWSQLDLVNDTRAELLKAVTLSARSDLVVQEYINVIHRFFTWLITDGVPPNHTERSWDILSNILPNGDRQAILDVACATEYKQDSKVVLVRLDSIDHVQRLRDQLGSIIKAVQSEKQIGPRFRPFEVVALAGDSDSLWEQLSDKARRCFGNAEPIGGLTVEKLVGVPCILIVCDKLAMGERLTPSCMAYDIRGR